jgi:hypothetical protein
MDLIHFLFLAFLALCYHFIERYWITPRYFFAYYLAASIALCAIILT